MNRPAFLLNSILLSFVTLISALLLSIFITSPHLLDASSTAQQFSADLSNVTGILPQPRIYDIDLKVDVVYSGLAFPTSFTFLGPDDIIVLEKNTGQVRRILNGTLLPDPLLSVSVSNQSERGMLGIALDRKNSSTDLPTPSTDVFLYFTESAATDRGNQTLGNHVYKYQLTENRLTNPLRLLDLPSLPGPAHNGGRIMIGPDDNVYFAIGNLNVNEKKPFLTKAEN
jgi:aldose sugar dehydrogenase